MATHKSHSTAILVFARSSKEEQMQKNINNGIELFNVLTEHTLHTVGKTGIPYFHYTENEQNGDNFGERFTNAIQSVFDKGFDRIITIGNDSPQLKRGHIEDAFHQLDTKKVVLGPSIDGGFYLLGLRKEQFEPTIFRELPWQTSQLTSQLKKHFFANGIQLIQLQWLYDIDDRKDLLSISKLTQSLDAIVLHTILLCLRENYLNFKIGSLPIWDLQTRIPQNRGSPLFHWT